MPILIVNITHPGAVVAIGVVAVGPGEDTVEIPVEEVVEAVAAGAEVAGATSIDH